MSRIILLILIFNLYSIVNISCIKSSEENAKLSDLKSVKIKNTTLLVEIADTKRKQEQGLMFRNTLQKNSGMLFIYNDDRRRSFWMKNTRIPLSIAFIYSNGVIAEIRHMKPFDQRYHISNDNVRFALEVNQGWFKKHGITAGDRMEFSESFQ